MKNLNAVGALLKKRCSSREKLEGWWVISPYFARENKSEKCHQLLELFIYHVCDEEKKKSDKSTQKKNWENNRRNIQKGCKIVLIKTAGAKQERNSVVTPKQKKVVEFYFYNFTCLRICSLFLD